MILNSKGKTVRYLVAYTRRVLMLLGPAIRRLVLLYACRDDSLLIDIVLNR